MSYIVITADPAKLRKVRKRLRRKGYTAYLPAIARVRAVAKGGKLKRRRRILLMMSYILVKIPKGVDFAKWLHAVTLVREVKGYCRVSGKPGVLDDMDKLMVEANIERVRRDSEHLTESRKLRKTGKARVKHGVTAGTVGTIVWVNNERIGIEMMVMNALRVVEMKAKDLEAA